MRFLRLILIVVFVLPLSALFRLPGKMAEDFVLGRLTDSAAEHLGMNTTTIENVVRLVFPLLPVVAALALISIYHSINEFLSPPKQTLVVEADRAPRSVLRFMKDIASVVFLALFVGGVLYTQYSYVPPASDSLRFRDLSQLSKPELRERAFQVASKIDNLNSKYNVRRSEIFSLYNRQMNQWTANSAAYDKAMDDYNRWHSTHQFSLYTGTLLGQSTQAAAPEPPYPSPVGPKPESPIVTVDQDWQQQMEATQEEAAAVWEEVNHRLGLYPSMFQVPATYDLNSDIASQSKRLRYIGNLIH